MAKSGGGKGADQISRIKCVVSMRSVGRVLISLPWSVSLQIDKPLKSVTYMFTFPAAGHHRPLTGNKPYCLVAEGGSVAEW